MKRAIIRGTGRYVPPRLVTNDDLSKWMETSDEWIRQQCTGFLYGMTTADAYIRSGLANRNEHIEEGRHFPTMDGKTIFKLAVQKLPEVVNEALEKAELALDDIDLFIPHQANLRINQFFQKSMKLPEGKVFNNIQRYGNTTAASIPIALDEAIEMNLIDDGSTVLFLGLGSGLTWGAVISKLVG